MPPTRRSAKPGTVAVITEDLRFAREAGGLHRCEPSAIVGTIAMLGADGDDEQDTLEAATRTARTLLATHLRQTCEAALADPANDVCTHAAAQSLHATMLRSSDQTQKVASIRRAVLSAAGCQLSLDGLRKREDTLLLAAAKRAHADLLDREQARGPQTVEEVVRQAGPLVKSIEESLHDGLPLLYQGAPNHDERARRGFMWNALLGVAVVLEHMRQIVDLHTRPGTHNRIDFLFGDIASHAMLVTFPDEDDKATVRAVLTSIDSWEISQFIPAIKAHPSGDAFLDRWGAWISSCHPTCAYQRADVVRLCCRPHQLTTALHEFGENYDDLVEGDLDAFLAEDLASWGLRTE